MQTEHIENPTLHLQYVLMRLLQFSVLHTCCGYIVLNRVHSEPVQCPANFGAVSLPQIDTCSLLAFFVSLKPGVKSLRAPLQEVV
jgi:hypothetical protein